MKRLFVWILILLMTAVCAYIYLSYRYKSINIFTVKDFQKESSVPAAIITDRKTLKELSITFATSISMKGVMKVTSPKYILEIYGFNNKVKTAYLWVDKESVHGMLMYESDTNKAYSISKENNHRIDSMISGLITIQ